jgi:hypothetical protein
MKKKTKPKDTTTPIVDLFVDSMEVIYWAHILLIARAKLIEALEKKSKKSTSTVMSSGDKR